MAAGAIGGALAFEEALAASVRRRFGPEAAMARLERLSGGASQELWSFDVETPSEPPRELILRRNPGGTVKREGSAGMEAEARIITLAREAGAPAPAVEHVFAPEEGLGSGYLMERVPGETLARRLLRDDLYATARPKLAFQLGAAAARIHEIDPAKAGELRQTTPQLSLEGSYALYQTNGGRRPVVEWAFRWLRERLPPPQETLCVVHGDMRNGNIMVGADGLRAVLDWEAVHVGDPMEDLGWLCVPSWRFGVLDKPVGGFGPREELWAGYESVTGHKVDRDRALWWEVQGTLRWGLSCAMMGREFQNGERNVEKAAIGRRASETEMDLLGMLAAPGGHPLV
jgi:aminoglycoside phosphotransferase (APT) family kinase protein